MCYVERTAILNLDKNVRNITNRNKSTNIINKFPYFNKSEQIFPSCVNLIPWIVVVQLLY